MRSVVRTDTIGGMKKIGRAKVTRRGVRVRIHSKRVRLSRKPRPEGVAVAMSVTESMRKIENGDQSGLAELVALGLRQIGGTGTKQTRDAFKAIERFAGARSKASLSSARRDITKYLAAMVSDGLRSAEPRELMKMAARHSSTLRPIIIELLCATSISEVNAIWAKIGGISIPAAPVFTPAPMAGVGPLPTGIPATLARPHTPSAEYVDTIVNAIACGDIMRTVATTFHLTTIGANRLREDCIRASCDERSAESRRELAEAIRHRLWHEFGLQDGGVDIADVFSGKVGVIGLPGSS